jgi:hypothetical protein
MQSGQTGCASHSLSADVRGLIEACWRQPGIAGRSPGGDHLSAFILTHDRIAVNVSYSRAIGKTAELPSLKPSR